jgi:hypothetical protein
MGYVADDAEARRRLVDDVHQIFSGAKLGDLPIYQTINFVINSKTAKALGLTIPPTLLAHRVNSAPFTELAACAHVRKCAGFQTPG